MADLEAWISPKKLAEDETSALLVSNMYMAQHWGIRFEAGNAGFDNEIPNESLLGIVEVRIDEASKSKTDYVGIVKSSDIRDGDSLTLFLNGSQKMKLKVSGVNQRGEVCEVELKNG